MSNIDIVRRLVDGAWRTVPAQSDTGVGGGGGSDTLSGLSDVTGEPSPGKAPVYDESGEAPLTHVATTADVDAILAGVAAVDWISVDPLNGFENMPNLFGDNWVPLRYRHNLNNIIHLEGVIKPPASQSGTPVVFAEMPEETRSGWDQIFNVPTPHYNEFGRVYLRADGRLELSGQAWDWISLCGISWSVEQSEAQRPPAPA